MESSQCVECQSPIATATPGVGRFAVFLDLEVGRRRDTEQVLHEVVPPPPHQILRVLAALAVKHVGNEQHVEILVGFHQRIDETHGFHGMHVVIDVSVLEKQMAFNRLAIVTFDCSA